MPRLSLRSGLLAAFLLFATLIVACRSPQLNSSITISITADGQTQEANVAAGITVTQALESVGIELGSLDKTEPPLYTVISEGDTIDGVHEANDILAGVEYLLSRPDVDPGKIYIVFLDKKTKTIPEIDEKF